eukprot:CAMPEP_0197541290 /NCGR_PEP_ID=MMETSP1318-20131121/67076_1 /TAXON_ID=552666 /ORGANISM="Partenskyella glossopodia, Strain RCC365" /LENGTH=410 /DNA_ID=CAMNT_0043100445 /DNA_START=117 /DNA_END=1349 /DNA_ORIENTATION=-
MPAEKDATQKKTREAKEQQPEDTTDQKVERTQEEKQHVNLTQDKDTKETPVEIEDSDSDAITEVTRPGDKIENNFDNMLVDKEDRDNDQDDAAEKRKRDEEFFNALEEIEERECTVQEGIHVATIAVLFDPRLCTKIVMNMARNVTGGTKSQCWKCLRSLRPELTSLGKEELPANIMRQMNGKGEISDENVILFHYDKKEPAVKFYEIINKRNSKGTILFACKEHNSSSELCNDTSAILLYPPPSLSFEQVKETFLTTCFEPAKKIMDKSMTNWARMRNSKIKREKISETKNKSLPLEGNGMLLEVPTTWKERIANYLKRLPKRVKFKIQIEGKRYKFHSTVKMFDPEFKKKWIKKYGNQIHTDEPPEMLRNYPHKNKEPISYNHTSSFSKQKQIWRGHIRETAKNIYKK